LDFASDYFVTGCVKAYGFFNQTNPWKLWTPREDKLAGSFRLPGFAKSERNAAFEFLRCCNILKKLPLLLLELI